MRDRDTRKEGDKGRGQSKHRTKSSGLARLVGFGKQLSEDNGSQRRPRETESQAK